MKNKNCSRPNALVEELASDWDKLNIAAKSLIIVGAILFISAIIIAFYSNGDEDLTRSLEVIFRSSLASVFGFLLSSNINTQKTKNNQVIRRDSCEEEIKIYNYKEGNMIQILIALVVTIVCIVAIIIIYITKNNENIAAISQLRDFMCSSIGFLLGESKIEK